MAPTPDDTLHIQPIRPPAPVAVSPAAAASIPATQDEAVARARAKLAAIQSPASQPAATTQPEAEAKVKPTAAKPKPRPTSRLRPIAGAVGTFVLLMVVFKAQVIVSQIGYLLHKNNQPAVAELPVAGAQTAPPEPLINIPKINVSVPVIYEPSIDEAKIQKDLEGGVVHYGNTAVPGQPGNSVIVGHSSNDWWEPGNYKFVFILLDKLAAGDNFSVNYNSVKYVYEVTSVTIVAPNDLSVIQPTPEPTITLITCTPPGTSWKRLIVKAKQVSPAPTTATASTDLSQPDHGQRLPGNAPGLLTQVSLAWKNITTTVGGWFGQHPSQSVPAPTAPSQTAPGQTLPGAK